jgi:hypothetical protein
MFQFQTNALPTGDRKGGAVEFSLKIDGNGSCNTISPTSAFGTQNGKDIVCANEACIVSWTQGHETFLYSGAECLARSFCIFLYLSQVSLKAVSISSVSYISASFWFLLKTNVPYCVAAC